MIMQIISRNFNSDYVIQKRVNNFSFGINTKRNQDSSFVVENQNDIFVNSSKVSHLAEEEKVKLAKQLKNKFERMYENQRRSVESTMRQINEAEFSTLSEVEKQKFILQKAQPKVDRTFSDSLKIRGMLEQLSIFSKDEITIGDQKFDNTISEEDLKPYVDEVSEQIVYPAKMISDALLIQTEASEMKSYETQIPEIKAYNRKVARLMRQDYSQKDIENLKKLLEKNRTFLIKFDNSNLKMSDVSEEENWEMSKRVWITDSMHIDNDLLNKTKNPSDVEAILISVKQIADFYCSENQVKQFEKVHKSNLIYQKIDGKIVPLNAYYEKSDPSVGVSHIMVLDENGNFKDDENWKNNKRLESHALAMNFFVKNIIDGITDNNLSIFSSNDEIPDNVINSIVLLARYFQDINYPYATTAGNWEELPFKEGLTSDIATITKAYENLYNLMYNEKLGENEEILKVRQRIDQKFRDFDCILNKRYIEKLIDQGHKRLLERGLIEHPKRPDDASLAMIVTIDDLKLSNNPLEDINIKLNMLEKSENLVRENGMIRYNIFEVETKNGKKRLPDAYLNLNYNCAIAPDGSVSLVWHKKMSEFASTDVSDIEKFVKRAEPIQHNNHEAQWFMVEHMAVGFVFLMNDFLDYASHKNTPLTDEEKKLALKLKEKADLYLNKSLARIVDENPRNSHQIKANGKYPKPFSIPEAYQFVTDINGNVKSVVGIDSDLSWAKSEMFKLLDSYLKLFEKIEKVSSENENVAQISTLYGLK